MGSLTTTTRVRLPAGPHDAELDRTGELFGRLERRLHVALRAIDRGLPGAAANRNALKVAFCAEHRITARHYNSLLRALDGKHASVIEKARIDAADLEDRLAAVRKKVADAVRKLERHAVARAGIATRAASGKAPTKGQAKDLLNDKDRAALRQGLHGRRRKADRLEGKIARLRALTERRVPPLVFGSRKLLRSRPQDGPRTRSRPGSCAGGRRAPRRSSASAARTSRAGASAAAPSGTGGRTGRSGSGFAGSDRSRPGPHPISRSPGSRSINTPPPCSARSGTCSRRRGPPPSRSAWCGPRPRSRSRPGCPAGRP